MDEEYDVIILGTGLTECILSGLLSVNGKKVLHIDRNDYYGGECASLTLDQAWKHFKLEGEAPQALGPPRKYNLDLIPKFLMAGGDLVKMLLHTQVTRYLEFKSIAGSYVLKERRISKVPASEKEALGSSLMGLFEKKRFKDFLQFVSEWDDNDPKTHHGVNPTMSSSDMMKKYKLDDGTMDILGHALALYLDETWKQAPAIDTIRRVFLYMDSLRSYGVSPYLYPNYGLGDLPQSFARLAAIYGGTFMLNKKIDGFTFDDKGRVSGVKSGEEVAKCKTVIGDPSYFTEKVKKIGEVVRCICILDHTIPYTNDSESVQIILPQNQVGRKNDIYISMVSSVHNICPQGKYVAIVSTTVETKDPKKELEAGLKYLGAILQQFWSVSPLYVPTNTPDTEHIHISKSYDATSHYDTTALDVLRLYKEVTGEKDVSYILIAKKAEDGQQQ
jgi:Rab GDP dissociation inhibitor